ncbi:hypothetical protein KA344_07890 [bacterium]|jgi:hypothetical protein|nr:hypothetical protein [bacterium]
MLLNDLETNQIVCSTQTIDVLLALLACAALAVAYKLWNMAWNSYYQMQVSVYENTVRQKIELLDSEIVRKKFTMGSEISQVKYDQELRYSKEAWQLAQTKMLHRDWKGAYKALKTALMWLSDYNLGHLPPRDMPQPRAAE